MTRCPTELELERHLLAPARSRIAPHLATCERCQDALAVMRAAGDEFRREVFPRTVDAVVERARTGHAWRVPRWAFGVVPLAAAAALLLVVRPPAEPPAGYVGTKGAPLALAVFVQSGDGARAVAEGEQVPARAALRFQVRPARPCRLWVVSVDGAGQVSRLYPPAGDAAAIDAAATLPGGALLDGRGGPERIFAACTAEPLEFGAVERAARGVAAGGPGAVRASRELRGLPRDAAQATVLLEKRP